MKIFTVGYEGWEIEDFTRFLKKNKIKIVIDTRKNPLSRKKGFSKNKLAEQLGIKKIEYLHLRNLGTPTEWRKLEKIGKLTRQKMFQMYVEKILPQVPDDLRLVEKLAQQKNVALLCYEADACDCHRFFIAKKISKQKKNIVHLRKEGPARKSISAFRILASSIR